ncbi:MAG: succinylglutamate desuccinylase/aspartoacylase family protein [Deltaproteobacteria bacterium]|nr:succinylglutamate desuccinylase/aspartoacylase family protein [Deltaproteobacteria bacterium]
MTTMIAVEPETERGIDRVIGSLRGDRSGPTLICIGGLHGNEPAGSKALQRVFAKLANRGIEIKGEFLGLVGNRQALASGHRFLSGDLNRHWLPHRIEASRAGELASSSVAEDRELDELRVTLEESFARARGTVYLLDIHTTSGDAASFAVMSDTLRNRRFAMRFPVPVIVGLEEELEGTVTEFVGGLGHVTIGFEGGQHDDPKSVDLSEAAIWIALTSSGVIDAGETPELEDSLELLRRRSRGLPRVFEVRFRHPVKPEDEFRMEPGFHSFDQIRRGQLLAQDRHGEHRARENGRILMPLYQSQGEDGYFEVRHFSPFWLKISTLLRRVRLDRVVHWLPGVNRHPDSPDMLIINRRIARFYSLQIFHLLGFRRHRGAGKKLVMTRQQRDFPLSSDPTSL